MRAWIARMTEDNIDQSAIEKAGEILKNGGLAAFPTETVYGLGGNALDAKASEKIYAAKGRPSDNPLIVHIGRMEDLETVAANVPESARKLAAACWPGPLTMIFEKTNAVPLETTGGLTSVAVRYPSNKVANALILAGGGFIAAPSANTSGRPSPTKAEHVIEDLGDKIDCIIDGGDAEIGLESTSSILQRRFRRFSARAITTKRCWKKCLEPCVSIRESLRRTAMCVRRHRACATNIMRRRQTLRLSRARWNG